MKKTARILGWALLTALVGVLLSCGGGANTSSNADQSVFLTAEVDGDGNYIEVEMIKNVTTDTAIITVCVDSFFNELNNSVATVNVTSYNLHFVRTDSAGTAVLPDKNGPLNLNVKVGADSCDTFEFPVVSSDDKIYGALGEEFHIDPRTIAEFDCFMTVYGKNLAGQDLEAKASFNIQLAAYLPHDELLPVIQSFVFNRSLMVGNDWNATWTAFGLISGGFLTDPFGRTVALGGFDFPLGNYSVNTGYLRNTLNGVPYVDFPAPQLIVGNPFGSVVSTGTEAVAVGQTLSVRLYSDEDPTDPSSVAISKFFADKYSLTLGESTNLSWVTVGAPTRLGMSPSSFSGVPVSFEGKDLAFDSINIVPEGSVNPLLYAYKDSDFSQASAFLDSPISVTGGVGAIDPVIQFFSVSHTSVPRFEQVAFFWKVTGDYEKVELFPINGVSKDVTGRESFFSPPLNREGANVFTLIVTGKNGNPIVTSAVNVSVTNEVVNLPPTIDITAMEPGGTIQNGNSGAFSFQIDDPENQDSSWMVRKIAGDQVYYGPTQGNIPTGHGQSTVSFDDGAGNDQGFFTFELTAFDDDNYGSSLNTQKSIELVTFNTSDVNEPNAPTIEDLTFTAGNLGNGGLLPGQDGVINFRVLDPANNRMFWSVEIIAGDMGGTLDFNPNYTEGTLNEGGGFVTVRYVDDPDSTDDAVVFKITATQLVANNPLTVVAILKVDYITDGEDTLDFAHIGLYYDSTAAATASPLPTLLPLLADDSNGNLSTMNLMAFYLNYDGTSVSAGGNFYADHAGAIPTYYLFLVTDIQHGTGDAAKVADIIFERDFISPSSDNRNFGEFLFDNYYDGPASGEVAIPPFGTGSTSVSRWFDVFDAISFRSQSGIYNLPITPGQVRDYQIWVRAYDEDNVEESIVLTLQIENNNATP